MGHRDDLLVTRQYTRMTNAAGGPPTRSVCLLGFVQVPVPEVNRVLKPSFAARRTVCARHRKRNDMRPYRQPALMPRGVSVTRSSLHCFWLLPQHVLCG